MNRIFLVVLLAGLALGGCARSADPLDWKISASEPDEADQWLNDNFPLLPKDLAAELAVSINNIKAMTPPGLGGEARAVKANRVCRQLDGHTVREVLLTGYELSTRMLVARLTNETEAVRQLSEVDHSLLTPEQEQSLMAKLDYHEKYRKTLKQDLGKAEKRVAELRASTRSN